MRRVRRCMPGKWPKEHIKKVVQLYPTTRKDEHLVNMPDARLLI